MNDQYEYDNGKEIPLDSCIKKISSLEFNLFNIPDYQRPYKWTAKNVNDLINDIITFKNKSSYRLGTLVIYNNKHKQDIVDGQQRIVTISLLMYYYFFEKPQDEKESDEYDEIKNKLQKFCKNLGFTNKYSIANIRNNIDVIKERASDLDDEFFSFFIDKCEFVVIRLENISEAFQFFDSQNARGKDLEAHDLLKAFHLREIKQLNEHDYDYKNIDSWQKQKTKDLVQLFLTMYRVKQWSKGKSARYFTKDDIEAFKGISMDSKVRYPYYQQEMICHIFSNIYCNDYVRKIDNSEWEYPFQLDHQCINGSRFFDMVRHYIDLYEKVKDPNTFKIYEEASEIISLLDEYEGKARTGDMYVREMFDTLLLYYVDRFGYNEIGKVVQKFFIWSYKLRLTSHAVQLASMDNKAKDGDESMFIIVRDARTPYDIINTNIEGLKESDCRSTKCDEIKNKYKDLHKLYKNE